MERVNVSGTHSSQEDTNRPTDRPIESYRCTILLALPLKPLPSSFFLWIDNICTYSICASRLNQPASPSAPSGTSDIRTTKDPNTTITDGATASHCTAQEESTVLLILWGMTLIKPAISCPSLSLPPTFDPGTISILLFLLLLPGCTVRVRANQFTGSDEPTYRTYMENEIISVTLPGHVSQMFPQLLPPLLGFSIICRVS